MTVAYDRLQNGVSLSTLTTIVKSHDFEADAVEPFGGYGHKKSYT